MKQIAKLIKEITGINIINTGRKVNREISTSKWLFYRYCSINGYQYRDMIKITGDKSFSTPVRAIKRHRNLCKTDIIINNQWAKLKKNTSLKIGY